MKKQKDVIERIFKKDLKDDSGLFLCCYPSFLSGKKLCTHTSNCYSENTAISMYHKSDRVSRSITRVANKRRRQIVLTPRNTESNSTIVIILLFRFLNHFFRTVVLDTIKLCCISAQ